MEEDIEHSGRAIINKGRIVQEKDDEFADITEHMTKPSESEMIALATSHETIDSESEENNLNERPGYHPEITTTTKVGVFINKLMLEYDSMKQRNDANEMYPRYRGKVLCFLYIPSVLGDYPLFTLGPDFKISCLELFLVNLAMHVVHQNHMGELLSKAVYTIQIA